jgi:D-methionine transport system substrate-binding protein
MRATTKKSLSLLIAGVLALALNPAVEARGNAQNSGSVLSVGATPVPHAELLNPIKDDVAAQGITLKVEPFGLYSAKYKNIDGLPNGASLAIPNDPSNGGRALLPPQAKGLIPPGAGAGLTAAPRDIALKNALLGKKVKDYIGSHYDAGVAAVFRGLV